MGYLVAVKGSARRASSGAGEWVHRRGPRREFQSKDEAREWARELSTPGYTCWVQDANPLDDSDVDGYIVAARYGRKGDVNVNGPPTDS